VKESYGEELTVENVIEGLEERGLEYASIESLLDPGDDWVDVEPDSQSLVIDARKLREVDLEQRMSLGVGLVYNLAEFLQTAWHALRTSEHDSVPRPGRYSIVENISGRARLEDLEEYGSWRLRVEG